MCIAGHCHQQCDHGRLWATLIAVVVSSDGKTQIDETFVAGFMLVDKLGLSAELGLSLVVRQTFYGFWFFNFSNEF